MGTVAGVDSSTQSCTLEVRNLDTGAIVAGGSNPHPATTPPCSEQDPGAWWSALEPLLDEHTTAVAGISVAAQQHGMVVLGSDNAVLRPAKLWNDTESAPQASELVERLGRAEWAQRCGSVPVASFTITKLAWLQLHEPDVYERLERVLLPHDWLTWKLTGEYVTDRGDASGTGYWSPASGDWDPGLLGLVGLGAETCPQILGPTALAGRRHDALVGPGTGDNMAAALGMGLRPGDVAVSIGTSGVVSTVSDRATADPSGAVAGFADATGRFLPLVCTLNAAKVTDAVGKLLGVDHEGLASLALEAPSGAGGVVLVPYFDGERTPNLPDATGTITGLRSDTTREQVARAAFEGVVCGLLEAKQALDAVGVDTTRGRLLLVGGGARSSAYSRILADLAERPVTVLDDADHVAAGACVQAAAVVSGGDPADIAMAWSLLGGETVEPDQHVDSGAVRAAYRHAARGRARPDEQPISRGT